MVYSMHTMRRMHIYLDDEQILELQRRARRSSQSVSAIVREAVDDKLGQPADTPFDSALSAAFGIWRDRDDLGPTDEYVRRLRGDTRA